VKHNRKHGMGKDYQKVSAHYGDLYNLHLVYCDEGGLACNSHTQKLLALDRAHILQAMGERKVVRMLSGNTTNTTNTTTMTTTSTTTTTTTTTTASTATITASSSTPTTTTTTASTTTITATSSTTTIIPTSSTSPTTTTTTSTTTITATSSTPTTTTTTTTTAFTTTITSTSSTTTATTSMTTPLPEGGVQVFRATGAFQVIFDVEPTELLDAWTINPPAVRGIFEECIASASMVDKSYVDVLDVAKVLAGQEVTAGSRRLTGSATALDIRYAVEMPATEAQAKGISSAYITSSIETRGASTIVAAISGSDPSLGLRGLVHKVIAINVWLSTTTTTASSTTSTTTTTDAVESSSWAIGVAVVVSVFSFLGCAFCGIYNRVLLQKMSGGGEQQPNVEAGAADQGKVAAPDVEVGITADEQVQLNFAGALSVEVSV